MNEEIVKEILKKIQESNATNELDAIPHSDMFSKKMKSTFGLNDEDYTEVISILKNSNNIFTFEITKEDTNKNIKRIDGYVDTNLETINRLRALYQNFLADAYNKQFHKNLGVHQIIKEIFPNIKLYNNTPLGYVANKAIMLGEYVKLLEKEYAEYTPSLKEEKLVELTEKSRQAKEKKTVPEETQTTAPRRAIDTKEYKTYEHDRQSLKKMLSIYGVNFFYRVNLRKYNFSLIYQALETGEIDRKKDLKILKDMLKTVKANDPEINKHIDEIYKLEKMISKSMAAAL